MNVRRLLTAALAGAALVFLAAADAAPNKKGGPPGQQRQPPGQMRHAPAPPARIAPAPMHRAPPPPRGAGAVVDWNHGYWHHGYYGSRFGWWWVVGPSWYFYSYPVYPYWYPPERTEVIVVEQPQPSGPPPQAYWYWCDDPKGYYPYVAQCPGGWEPVPATPPAPATK